MAILPVDTCKSTLQVNGKDGLKQLRIKVANHGPGVLYHGSMAGGLSTTVGHFPWFFTCNYLNERFPRNEEASHLEKIIEVLLLASLPPVFLIYHLTFRVIKLIVKQIREHKVIVNWWEKL